MYKYFIKAFVLLNLYFLVFNISVSASSFNESLINIRAEINRDNLDEAIKKLKKITVSNDREQEQINILFGDIYLKINQPQKAEEFYNESLFTSDDKLEALTFNGLAEVRLLQGRLDEAIRYSEKSIKLNNNKVRPKIILAIAKTRLGANDEALEILNELYYNKKNAEVTLALADYLISFDDIEKAISLLEEFILTDPNNIKVLDQLASLYLVNGNKDQAIEYKFKVYKYHEVNRNKKKLKQAKLWILSINPKYFDKPVKIRKKEKQENIEYEEEEIKNYEENKISPYYEEFDFAYNRGGSGFIVGDGKFVITNHHVIEGAKKIAVRNGIGKVSNAKIAAISNKYDLAILELDKPYPKNYAVKDKNILQPKAGEDIISVGYPNIGMIDELPTITEGIVSKIFKDDGIHPIVDGKFLMTARINQGNSGGPIFNLKGQLVGVSVEMFSKEKWKNEFNAEITDVGIGIKGNIIKDIFNHKKGIPVNAKFEKSKLYEKMLPTVVFVVVSDE